MQDKKDKNKEPGSMSYNAVTGALGGGGLGVQVTPQPVIDAEEKAMMIIEELSTSEMGIVDNILEFVRDEPIDDYDLKTPNYGGFGGCSY